MWPWGHAAVGYLVLWAYVRLRAWVRPRSRFLQHLSKGAGEGPAESGRTRANGSGTNDAVRAHGRERSTDGDGALVGRSATISVLLGTQLPDLVDKPLAWGVPVLPSGRSLGHSLLIAVPVVVVCVVVARRRGRPLLGVAFGFGYLTGILTDVPASVLTGDFSRATFLVWPILPSPTYDLEPSFLAHLAALELTGWFVFQTVLGLAVATLAIWEYHRAGPGS